MNIFSTLFHEALKYALPFLPLTLPEGKVYSIINKYESKTSMIFSLDLHSPAIFTFIQRKWIHSDENPFCMTL